MGEPHAEEARCQVLLNEVQSDAFNLRPRLDAAPCKVLAAV